MEVPILLLLLLTLAGGVIVQIYGISREESDLFSLWMHVMLLFAFGLLGCLLLTSLAPAGS